MRSISFLDVWSLSPECLDRHRNSVEYWVALDPQARCFLHRQGVTDDRIHSEVEHVSNKRREFLVEISCQTQKWLRKQICFPEFGDLNWSLSELCLWYCYWVVNYCLWILELNNIFFNLFKPDDLRAGQPAITSHKNGYVSKADGFLSQLTAEFAASRRIEFQGFIVKESSNQRARVALKHGLGPVRDFILSIGTKAKNEILIRKLSKHKAGPILVSTTYPPMTRIIERLQKNMIAPAYVLDGEYTEPFAGTFNVSESMRILNMKSPELQLLLNKLGDIALSIERETDLFTHVGVSFVPLLAKKFREGIISAVLAAYGRARVIETILKTTKPQVLLSIGNRDEDLFTGVLCKRLKIPGIMVFHGSMIVPKTQVEHAEVSEQTIGKLQSSFPYIALQTPLMESHCQVFPSASKRIRTGPLVIGNQVRKEYAQQLRQKLIGDNTVRVVTHSSTPKGGRGLRFHIYETFNEYIQSIKELAETVEDIPETHLIVKFRPSECISIENIKTLVPFSDKVTLSVDEPFLDVLGFTDLLVSFTSTTIEEALMNRVPVLLYGARGRNHYLDAPRYQPGMELPISPVYAIDEPSHLSRGIEEILDKVQNLETTAFDPYCYSIEEIQPIEVAINEISGTGIDGRNT